MITRTHTSRTQTRDFQCFMLKHINGENGLTVQGEGHKPIYVGLKDSPFRGTIVEAVRSYSNAVRITGHPGQVVVLFTHREPGIILVDNEFAPALYTSGKNQFDRLCLLAIAERPLVESLNQNDASRFRFLPNDCSRKELFHTLRVLQQLAHFESSFHVETRMSDLLGLVTMGQHEGTLTVKLEASRRIGKVGVANGQIVFAEVADNSGQPALNELLRWKQARFDWADTQVKLPDAGQPLAFTPILVEDFALREDLHQAGLSEGTDTSMFPMSFLTSSAGDNSSNEIEASLQTEEQSTEGLGAPTDTAHYFIDSEPSEGGGERTDEDYDPRGFIRAEKTDSFIQSRSFRETSPLGSSTSFINEQFPLDTPNTAGPYLLGHDAYEDFEEPWRHHLTMEILMKSNADDLLKELQDVAGFIAAAVVDSDSGMTLAKLSVSKSFDIEVAAATNTEVIKAKLRAQQALHLDDAIEDILISLTGQYHLIRPIEEFPSIFFYIALDRNRANLAMARLKLKQVGSKITF